MWLLDAATHELCEFFGSQIPPYAILSHTWGPPSEEVSFRELQDQPGRAKLKPGYSKIHAVCAEAIEHRYRYTWVDSCCIDKSSSAELSEAINSMFKWYQSAGVCMVHLSDVTFSDGPELADAFERSRWFRRGWTLQELIAPSSLRFYDSAWRYIGGVGQGHDSDSWLAHKVAAATGITAQDFELGNVKELYGLPVAKRMSWAARRETTREEDIAYCLMGLFNVSMPILYGEGEEKAFKRLQHEIIRTSADHSIFAWKDSSLHASGALARSPAAFAESGSVGRRIAGEGKKLVIRPFQMTNVGLSICLPIELLDDDRNDRDEKIYAATLTCYDRQNADAGNVHLLLRHVKVSGLTISDTFQRVRCGELLPRPKRRSRDLKPVTIYILEADQWQAFRRNN